MDTFRDASAFFEKLASAASLTIVEHYEADDAVSIVTDAATAYIPMGDLVDFEKEKARLSTELKKTEGEIERLEKKLSNEGFVAKAPAAVVEAERVKLEKYKATREQLAAALAKLG